MLNAEMRQCLSLIAKTKKRLAQMSCEVSLVSFKGPGTPQEVLGYKVIEAMRLKLELLYTQYEGLTESDRRTQTVGRHPNNVGPATSHTGRNPTI